MKSVLLLLLGTIHRHIGTLEQLLTAGDLRIEQHHPYARRAEMLVAVQIIRPVYCQEQLITDSLCLACRFPRIIIYGRN
jgi:hypothetical protein